MIRLFVGADLKAASAVDLDEAQSHYLTRVMRLGLDDTLLVFNGRDGEWRARLSAISRRGARLTTEALTRPQAPSPDVELIIALVKRARLETIIEKAAELGARRIRLALSERTNADRANLARLSAIAVEAAEQCGRLEIPPIAAPERLSALLGGLAAEGRRLMFCDEAGEASPAAEVLAAAPAGPWAVLIGPEGGFSATERAAVRALPTASPVSLGPRILRADTAAIAALGLWQSTLGDWRGLELGRSAGQVSSNRFA